MHTWFAVSWGMCCSKPACLFAGQGYASSSHWTNRAMPFESYTCESRLHTGKTKWNKFDVYFCTLNWIDISTCKFMNYIDYSKPTNYTYRPIRAPRPCTVCMATKLALTASFCLRWAALNVPEEDVRTVCLLPIQSPQKADFIIISEIDWRLDRKQLIAHLPIG